MKPDGGPAFPGFQYTEGRGETRQNAIGETEVYAAGMTLRDYFAAAAIPEAMKQTDEVVTRIAMPPEPRSNAARIAYELADAMLAERAK